MFQNLTKNNRYSFYEGKTIGRTPYMIWSLAGDEVRGSNTAVCPQKALMQGLGTRQGFRHRNLVETEKSFGNLLLGKKSIVAQPDWNLIP